MEQTGIKTPKNVGALQPKGKAAVEKKGKQNTVVQWLSDPTFRSQLETALPKFLNADTFIRNALTDFRKQPLLQQCSTPSVLGYYMAAAQCGLTPGTTLGQCYAVPFRNKNTGQMECEFIIGYRGMLSIVRRSGEVASVEAKAVYEKDKIEVIDGVNPNIIHERYMGGDRGAFVGAYCIVRFKDKDVEPVMEYMSKFEIDKHRRRSKAANSGPWVTDYDEMAKKTVFRSMFKWLPISIEQVMAVTSDGGNVKYNEKAENPEDVLEITFSTPEDGEEVAAEEALAEGAEVPEPQGVEDAVEAMAEQMKME